MKIGVFTYNTDDGPAITELARAAEERGFDSLWVPEHTHIPASRETAFPGGGELPRPYYRMADPFVSLAAAAAVTERLLLGTGISLVVQHDPIVLAKTIASLDRISGGRFLFGIGAGWNREELENHGPRFASRWRNLRERIEAMQVIWREEEASYQGEFVAFERIISHPKPLQQPGPPVILGGATANSRQRVVDYCDGWMPIDALIEDPAAQIRDLQARAAEAGRDPASISLTMFCQKYRQPDDLARFTEAGFERSVIALPNRDRDTLLRILDRYLPLL